MLNSYKFPQFRHRIFILFCLIPFFIHHIDEILYFLHFWHAFIANIHNILLWSSVFVIKRDLLIQKKKLLFEYFFKEQPLMDAFYKIKLDWI